MNNTTTELHRLLERVRELECRLEDLAALVAARRCTCQREEYRDAR